MVTLAQINKRYGRYLECPIALEWNDDEQVFFVYLKRPYVLGNNQSVYSADNLDDIVDMFKNVDENPEWWNKEYGGN